MIVRVSMLLGRCPLSRTSSMCMMYLKYRIILLIVINNPWVHLLTYFLLRGAAPYPGGTLTPPLKTPAGLLATFGGFDILITAWQLCIYRFAI